MKIPRHLLRVENAEQGSEFAGLYLGPAADTIAIKECGESFYGAKTDSVKRAQESSRRQGAQWREISFSANKHRLSGELIIAYNVLLRSTMDPKRLRLNEVDMHEELSDWYLGESNRQLAREQEYIMTTENFVPAKASRLALIENEVIIGTVKMPSRIPDAAPVAMPDQDETLNAEIRSMDVWLPVDANAIVRGLHRLDLLQRL